MQPLMALEFALGGALRGAGIQNPALHRYNKSNFLQAYLCRLFVWLNFPIEYIFGSLIIDYIVKGILFTYRFESGRWIKLKT